MRLRLLVTVSWSSSLSKGELGLIGLCWWSTCWGGLVLRALLAGPLLQLLVDCAASVVRRMTILAESTDRWGISAFRAHGAQVRIAAFDTSWTMCAVSLCVAIRLALLALDDVAFYVRLLYYYFRVVNVPDLVYVFYVRRLLEVYIKQREGHFYVLIIYSPPTQDIGDLPDFKSKLRELFFYRIDRCGMMQVPKDHPYRTLLLELVRVILGLYLA